MSAKMQAAIYRKPGQLDLGEIDVPVAGQGRVVVEIDYCGICGTDLHMVIDGWGTPGTVFGHEWSGRVADPGDTDLVVGTAVVGLPSIECRECDPCRRGRPSLCANRPEPGSTGDHGAFTSHVVADVRQLVPVPPGVDQRAAALTEPLAVALHAVTNSGITDGQRALVFGCGPIGAAIIAILSSRGIEVAAVEPGAVRQGLARRLGASVSGPDDVVLPAHPGLTLSDAFDMVFESSGARSAMETALTQLCVGGTLVMVGTGLDLPRLDTNRVILNELHVTGAFNYDADGFAAALALIASGDLPLDDLLESDVVGLDGLLDAMHRLRAGEIAGKVLVKP